jgi:allantoinase
MEPSPPHGRVIDGPSNTAWSPITKRKPFRWPQNAYLAVCVIVYVEHLELWPDPMALPAPDAVTYGPYPAAFQLARVSEPAYGSRVGAFRLLEVIEGAGIRPMVAVDSLLLPDLATLVKEYSRAGAEFLGHGPALSRQINESVAPATEEHWIADSIAAVEEHAHRRPTGWVGAEYGQSTRTLGLLGAHGIRYVCDWANDEQPYDLSTGNGTITSLPVAVDLDDLLVCRVRRLPPWRWADLVEAAVDQLWLDGRVSGRLLVLALHAHVSGQPFHIKYVAQVLKTLSQLKWVWLATGSEIDEWHRNQ